MNSNYQHILYSQNPIQQQQFLGELNLTNTEKYVVVSRLLGISVALYQVNKAKPIKTGSDLVESLFIATLFGGIFPLPYLGFVALDTLTDKKKKKK
jgi:hypothetical protein